MKKEMVRHKMPNICYRLPVTAPLMYAFDFHIRVILGNIQIIEPYTRCSEIDYTVCSD